MGAGSAVDSAGAIAALDVDADAQAKYLEGASADDAKALAKKLRELEAAANALTPRTGEGEEPAGELAPEVRKEEERAGELAPEVRETLTKLDDRLVGVLERGDIRLVRSSWLLAQPAGYRMQRRQDMEALERGRSGASPLLSAEEAVDLVRRGDRSAGTLTYGWLTPGNPDPAGARIAVLRRLLEQHPHIEGFFWEYVPSPPLPSSPRICRHRIIPRSHRPHAHPH